MLIEINHPSFLRRKLQVHLKGFFLQPFLLYDNKLVQKDKKVYSVLDDNGNQLMIKFKVVLGDTIPSLMIGEEEFRILPKLKWYESLLVYLPLGLIGIGGAVGGGIGAATCYLNSYIVRKYYEHPIFKYLLPFVTTILSVVLFFLVRDIVLILLAM